LRSSQNLNSFQVSQQRVKEEARVIGDAIDKKANGISTKEIIVPQPPNCVAGRITWTGWKEEEVRSIPSNPF